MTQCCCCCSVIQPDPCCGCSSLLLYRSPGLRPARTSRRGELPPLLGEAGGSRGELPPVLLGASSTGGAAAAGCPILGEDARMRFLQLVSEGLWLPGRRDDGDSSCACNELG